MDHKKLTAWKSGIELVVEIYELTKKFPKNEDFGLKSQMRRAVISVPSNIAEGAARDSIKEYIRFLNIASGSIAELETQVILAEKLKYITDKEVVLDKIVKVRKLCSGLKKYLKEKLR